MTWTYNDSDSDLDRVRRKVGDKDSKRPLLSDEEIGVEIAAQPDLVLASIRVAEQIKAKLAYDSDRQVMGISSERATNLTTQLDGVILNLRKELNTHSQIFSGGGVPKAATATAASVFENLDY